MNCFTALGRHSGALLLVVAGAGSALAYDYNDTPTGYLFGLYNSVQIQQKIGEGWRPTSIDCEGVVGPIGLYRTVFVRNAGPHLQTVRYEGEKTEAQINAVRNAGWRIEDVEVVGSKFSAVFIRNVNPAKDTTWFGNATAANVSSFLTQNPTWRLLEIDRYGTSNGERYSGVAIRNTGAGAVSGWGWMPNQTLTEVTNWAQANNMRVIDLAPGSNGRYAAIFRRNAGGQRYYYFGGIVGTRVNELLGGLGLRLVTLASTGSGGSQRYAMTAIDNVNAQSARLAELCKNRHNGFQGFYVHQMGASNPIVGLNHNLPMHPSSSIKALIHYTGAWRTPADQLNTRVLGGQLMRTWHQAMMYNSDNPSSNFLMDAYTITQLESVAHNILGMSQVTQMRNRFGTGGPYGNDQINETTLQDFGRLYTAIQDRRLGSVKTAWLRANMNNETRSMPFSNVMTSVRNEIGISSTRFNDWRGRIRGINKAGNNGDGDINGYWSVAGVLTLPYKNGPLTLDRHFLYGHFVNRSTIDYDSGDAWPIVGEMLREQIRESMLTFR